MKELTDLEVCKRIAELEGHIFDDGGKYFRCMLLKFDKVVGYIDYNPLTDDALCFTLSKKYNVCIMHHEEYSTARIWDDPEDNPIADFSDINNDTSLNKAICLSIIEANK